MISQKIHKERRKTLMMQFDSNDIIYLKGKSEVLRNTDVCYEFRQDSNVMYLSGINMKNVSLLMIPAENKYVLFAPESTTKSEIGTGKKPSLEQLKIKFKADEVYSSNKILEILEKYNQKTIHSLSENNEEFSSGTNEKLCNALFEMRYTKSPEEIKEIENALEITAQSYEKVMGLTRPGMNERELHATIDFIYRSNGVTSAFLPIVTTKGAVLHSESNRNLLKDGKLLLVDSGCEVNGYASDITRTFPVNGKFTAEQKEIYNIVLRAKNETIKKIKPGNGCIKDLDNHARKIIAEGLKDVGILKGNLDLILENKAQDLFFPHGLSHLLGLDAHDMLIKNYHELSLKKQLQPGHVFTVEPGIYFIAGLLNNPEEYKSHKEFVNLGKARNLISKVSGIRIEDDILVTRKGCRVLGKIKIPEEVEDLERIIGTNI